MNLSNVLICDLCRGTASYLYPVLHAGHVAGRVCLECSAARTYEALVQDLDHARLEPTPADTSAA